MQWPFTWRTWINVDLSLARCSGIHRTIHSREILRLSITKISLEIIYLKVHSNIQGANEPTIVRTFRLRPVGYVNGSGVWEETSMSGQYNQPLTRYVKLLVAHATGMPGKFSHAADFKANRLLAIPACITARAWRTCRDVCRDRLPIGKTFLAFLAHAHPQFSVSGKRHMDHDSNGVQIYTIPGF